MTDVDPLAEQHIREHESRLRHIVELLARAREQAAEAQPGIDTELDRLAAQREQLAGHLEKMRLTPGTDWREKEIELAGPMGLWDALAQQLEKLVERFER
jgi:hypothetical protein